jgi:hypothetical protein
MLHQYLLGLLKSSVEYTKLAISWYGRTGRETGTLSKASRFRTLDERFQTFNQRHAGVLVLLLLLLVGALFLIGWVV